MSLFLKSVNVIKYFVLSQNYIQKSYHDEKRGKTALLKHIIIILKCDSIVKVNFNSTEIN